MMELLLRCPRCGRTRRWISYEANSPEELEKKRTPCYYCQKGTIRIKNCIEKIVRMEAHPNRVPYTDIINIIVDEIRGGETSKENLKTIIMNIGATEFDFMRAMNQLHNEGIIYYPNKSCVMFNG